jgi:CRP-like cAMP-binding protein
MEPLPAVELVDRMRRVALFDAVSVDELFRIAAAGRQVWPDKGRRVYEEGGAATDVHVLLEGAVSVLEPSEPGAASRVARTLAAPAALGFEEALKGGPIARTVETTERSVCLALTRDDLLTLVSDSPVVAQALFRMLMTPSSRQTWETRSARASVSASAGAGLPLPPIDKVAVLRDHPLFASATVEELLELAAITREVALVTDSILFTEHERPAVYHVLEGELRVVAADGLGFAVGPGQSLGVAETLVGAAAGRRATVSAPGRALRLGHEDLFGVLTDHVDLLQALFNALGGAATDAGTTASVTPSADAQPQETVTVA